MYPANEVAIILGKQYGDARFTHRGDDHLGSVEGSMADEKKPKIDLKARLGKTAVGGATPPPPGAGGGIPVPQPTPSPTGGANASGPQATNPHMPVLKRSQH